MGKYSFKFQTMLSLKEKMQEQKEIEYGIAVQKLEEEKTILNEKYEAREKMVENFRQSVSESINPKNITDYNYYINRLSKEIDAQKNVIEKCEEETKEKQRELFKALSETKMFEKLKEKGLEEYIKEQKIEENKMVDEIVTYRYTNKEN